MLIEILCGVLAITTIFSLMLVYYSLKRITQYEEIILQINDKIEFVNAQLKLIDDLAQSDAANQSKAAKISKLTRALKAATGGAATGSGAELHAAAGSGGDLQAAVARGAVAGSGVDLQAAQPYIDSATQGLSGRLKVYEQELEVATLDLKKKEKATQGLRALLEKATQDLETKESAMTHLRETLGSTQSELADKKTEMEQLKGTLEEDLEMEVVIANINRKDREIILSLRALEKQDEKSALLDNAAKNKEIEEANKSNIGDLIKAELEGAKAEDE